MNCKSCKWWDQSCSPETKREAERRIGDESGLCRRYPPVLDSLTPYTPDIVTESPCAFVQPLTWESDWCGEWVGA